MDNYFILLGLPFDPPETDNEKIKAAISKKQAEWSRDANNPVKKAKALGYLEKLDEIKKVMLDANSRAKEANKAKEIKTSKKKELEEKIQLYRSKGGALSEKDLRQLVRLFGPFGYREDEIRERFNEKPDEKKDFDPSKVLDSSQARNIQNGLRQLDMADKTLYEFLGLPATSTCSQLREAADAMKKKILAKGTKTAWDSAAQPLCGLCIVIFKDPESKQKYDNYVNITKYHAVNEATDELALSNQKRIEPKMKESLIDIAVSRYHISVSDASVYINQYCEYKGYALPENKIICGLCNTENHAGATNCIKCGKPLIIVCPSCAAQNNNSAKTCAKCGFDLTKMEQAVALLRQAKQKYAEKALEDAERLVKEAKAYWPNHPDILALEKTILDDRNKAKEIIGAIMRDIQEKRFYAAQTKIGQAKASGFDVDVAIVKNVNNVISETEAQLAVMRKSVGDEAFTIAMRLTEMIVDSDELNQSLKKFPPAEVPELRCKQVGDALVLEWKPSSAIGEIVYQLVRKENSYPNDPADGTTIYQGKERAYTDHSLQKNTVYYYSVFAVRIGVCSKATKLSEPVAIVEKISGIKAVGGDEMITLSWKKAMTVTEIRLFQYCGLERPEDDSAYQIVNCTRLDGMTITGLKNGTNYWFAISAGHHLNGKTFFSEKAYFSAVPQKPAKPLEDFEVALVEDVIQAKWSASDWDVIFFVTKKKPEYAVGTIYDLDELLSRYDKVDVNLKSRTEGDFRLDFVGECYIIPGVINASNVILNTAAHLCSVQDVKEISFDMNASGTEMYVNFKWPKKIDRTLLVYRTDRYPDGPDDPLAIKVECNKRQYEANEGILINNPPVGIIYALIYAYYQGDQKRVYSNGCQALLSNESQKDVFYTFHYKKAGLFSKKCKLTMEITCDEDCVFPPFVIVTRMKTVPLKRGDGEILCTCDQPTELRGSYTFTFDVPALRPDTRLKLFFLNDKYYKSFKIACKAGNTI